MRRRKLETLLLTLESTASLLARAAVSLTREEVRWKPQDGGFSLLENVWHLADLEREAFSVRIRRILSEEEPTLSNFDGERIARERVYNERDLAEGLVSFAQSRARNVEILRGKLSRSDWKRGATQESVGRITLDDIPRLMAEHDISHTMEIRNLLAHLKDGLPLEKSPTSAVA
jgi:hypothetical protein